MSYSLLLTLNVHRRGYCRWRVMNHYHSKRGRTSKGSRLETSVRVTLLAPGPCSIMRAHYASGRWRLRPGSMIKSRLLSKGACFRVMRVGIKFMLALLCFVRRKDILWAEGKSWLRLYAHSFRWRPLNVLIVSPKIESQYFWGKRKIDMSG